MICASNNVTSRSIQLEIDRKPKLTRFPKEKRQKRKMHLICSYLTLHFQEL